MIFEATKILSHCRKHFSAVILGAPLPWGFKFKLLPTPEKASHKYLPLICLVLTHTEAAGKPDSFGFLFKNTIHSFILISYRQPKS
jgi:hypothetical protein